MAYKKQKGFSLLEMLVYVLVLSLFSLLIVESIVAFSGSYKKLRVAREISSSASLTFERITREIRQATQVDQVESVLNSSSGKLRLMTTNDDGYVQVVSFVLENDAVNVYVNDLLSGPLTSAKASTTDLVFRLVTSGRSESVKVEMTLKAGSGQYERTEKFYSTVLMRNSL